MLPCNKLSQNLVAFKDRDHVPYSWPPWTRTLRAGPSGSRLDRSWRVHFPRGSSTWPGCWILWEGLLLQRPTDGPWGSHVVPSPCSRWQQPHTGLGARWLGSLGAPWALAITKIGRDFCRRFLWRGRKGVTRASCQSRLCEVFFCSLLPIPQEGLCS